MYTYAHPLVSATLMIVTCTVLFANAIMGPRSEDPAFPAYKPQPSHKEVRRHAMMIGHWVGESPVGAGGQRRVLLQRSADGTFEVTFETCRGEHPVLVEKQVGQWGLSGPVYFTITTGWVDGDRIDPTEPGEPYFYDAYRVINLQHDLFEYESFSDGRRYVMRRVADSGPANDL